MLAWVATAFFCGPTPVFAQSKMAPVTPVEKVKEVLHGVALVDPYRWLEDQNSPRTRAWIAAQNEYTQSVLKNGTQRADLTQRIDALLKVDVQSLPMKRNGHYFFSKRLVSQDQAVLYVRDGLEGKDEVLIDPHGLSADHMVSVAIMDVSQDGKLLAYGVRHGGEDEVEVRFLDVDTRKDLPDSLNKARYFGLAIRPDKSGFYYTRFGKEGPRVYYHQLGTDPSTDRKLFGDGYGPEKIISSRLSEEGRYLLISVSFGSAAVKTEVYFQDLSSGGAITPLVNDIEARFSAQIAGDTAYMETNWQAPNGRLMAVDLKKPAKQNWKEIVPAGKFALTGFTLVGGMLAVDYLENITSRVKLFDANGKLQRDMELPGLGATA